MQMKKKEYDIASWKHVENIEKMKILEKRKLWMPETEMPRQICMCEKYSVAWTCLQHDLIKVEQTYRGNRMPLRGKHEMIKSKKKRKRRRRSEWKRKAALLLHWQNLLFTAYGVLANGFCARFGVGIVWAPVIEKFHTKDCV